ncbi:MAG: thiol reductant ABC exporter subunit CydD, partial [Leptolinea sp.]
TRIALGLVISSAALSGGLIILQAWLLAKIINQVHLDSAGLAQVAPIFIPLITVIILRAVFVFINELSAAIVSEKIKTGIRDNLSRKILNLGPAFINQQKSGELAYTITQAVDSLDAYFSQYIPQMVIAAILPIGILTVVFPLDTLSAVILLLTAPLIPVFMVLIGRTTEALTRQQYSAFSRMSAFFLDTLRGLSELKNLGRSADHASRLDQVSQRYREATLRVLRISFLSALVLELAATLSVAVIAVEIGLRLLYGQIAFQQAFFLLVIAPEFYQPLRQLGARFHAAQNGVSAARRIFEILDQPENSAIPATDAVSFFGNNLFREPFKIRFENVSFAYPGREQDAVSNVSFILHSGRTIALVGLNGSGKSTLAALLLRFIQPHNGRILYNDIDIQSIPVIQWRAGIAWLDQQPVLLNDSIRQNLLLSRPGASPAQLQYALDESCLSETIAALPSGLDTELGENAFRFSGGQAQRLSLARAFLKDAPLLILDEPTSHLDALLEAELDSSLDKLSKNRTALLIAHRKTTAYHADQILVMDRGRLVEQGTHVELIGLGKFYAKLFGGVE